jgi:hypothetical protein
MGAKYVSQKPDGYLRTRNNIYLERGTLQQARELAQQEAGRNLPGQSMVNYGKNDLLFRG